MNAISRFLFTLLVWNFLIGSTFAILPYDFYVAKNGNDQNPGTLKAPFATIHAARDAIRELLSEVEQPGAVFVWIGEGTYEFAKPLVLEQQDSRSRKFPVIYRAKSGEKVQLSGSRSIKNFQVVSDAQVLDRLSPEAHGNVYVADLQAHGINDFGKVAAKGNRLEVFFQGKPMQLARWPNVGFAKIVEVVGKTSFKSHGIPGTKEGWFTYDHDRPSRWVNEPEAWLHGYWFWDWSDAYQRIESIDAATKTIRLTDPYHHYGYRNNQRYYAINLLSELDQPGEWYVDRQAGLLYFWPPAPIEKNDVAVSVLPHLVKINGCTGVKFENLTFEGTRSTAITITDSKDCLISDCTIRNTGTWGVSIRDGSHCEVRHSELYALGEGGVSLRGGDRATLEPAYHACISNHIHNFGRLYRTYRPAVGISGVGNRVAHNHIHDGPHNAIQLGGNEHLVEYNEIHNVCYETGDVGAFYMGRDWTQRGTIIRHNYFHDISGPGLHGAMAVYLDDAASGIQIIGNVFNRAGRAAFIGGGRDNLVENNIFVDCQPSVHVDARGIGWMHETIASTMPDRLKVMPYQKSPWKERYPQLLTVLEDEPGKPKYNVVRRNISWGGTWLNVAKEAEPLITFEENLVEVDPQFTGDPRSPEATILDFKLQPNSPALKSGFQPIPLEKIGLLEQTSH